MSDRDEAIALAREWAGTGNPIIEKLAEALIALHAEYKRMWAVYEAAVALCAQPMLVKGADATWGDVAQSHAEGPRLLAALVAALATATKEPR